MIHKIDFANLQLLSTTPYIEGKNISDYKGIVVGIDIDYEVVGKDGSMMMVSVSGTAVSLS
jgi:uncharacterized protein YbjQ (UPF0145 family)